MIHISKITPINYEEKHTTVDQWLAEQSDTKKHSAALVTFEAKDKNEAQRYYEALKLELLPLLQKQSGDSHITPPARSTPHGNQYIVRVIGSSLEELADDKFLSRKQNPPSAIGKRSFVELLDEAYKAKQTFTFFVNDLLKEWGSDESPMSVFALYKWIKVKNDEVDQPSPNLKSIYKWADPDSGIILNKDNINSLASIFIPERFPLLTSEKPHIRHQYVLKMGRLLSGRQVDPLQTQQWIDEAKQSGRHDEVFAKLFEATGLGLKKIAQMAEIPYSTLWEVQQGRHIRRGYHSQIPKLLALANPPTLDPEKQDNPEIVKQNKELQALITGRSATFNNMLLEAPKNTNPSAALFNMLTGPYGNVRLSDEEIALEMTKQINIPYTARQIQDRRLGKKKLIESEALVITKLGGCSEEQQESFVEMLTGIKAPGKLLDAVESLDAKTKITINEMFHLTCERKGISSEDFGMARPYVARFEFRPGRLVSPISARKMADRIGLSDKDRRRFILHAIGKKNIDVDRLLQEAKDDPSKRAETLRTMFEWMNVSLNSFAKRLNTSPNIVQSWFENGVITHRHPERVTDAFEKRLFVEKPKAKFATDFQKAFYPQTKPR